MSYADFSDYEAKHVLSPYERFSAYQSTFHLASHEIQTGQRSLKVMLVGDSEVGKTTFASRIAGGSFISEHVPTNGVSVNAIPMMGGKNPEPFSVSVWDRADPFPTNGGNSEAVISAFGGLGEAYNIGAHGAIIFFDVTRPETYANVPKHYRDIVQVCGSRIPIVLVGTHVDCRERVVKPVDITFHRKHNMQYYDISSKSLFALFKPISYIMARYY
jgi:GTP-binding nuclear protein Ran